MEKRYNRCADMCDHHYENPGEKPYIKYTCGNKMGLNPDYQVDPYNDYCSRFNCKPLPELHIGDEVYCNGIKGVIVREVYEIGSDNDRDPFLVVWYGTHMSSTLAYDVEPTGVSYSEIAEIMEKLKKD